MRPSRYRSGYDSVDETTSVGAVEVELKPITSRSKYLLVFVFANPDFGNRDDTERALITARRQRIIRALKEFGLVLFFQKSRDDDELFVKVGATQEQLENFADDLRVVIKLKEEGRVAPKYAPFKKSAKNRFCGRADSTTFKFRPTDALRILLTLIEEKKEFGGCEIDYGREIQEGGLVAFFPIHGPAVQQLYDTWATPWKTWEYWKHIQNAWTQPLDDIRDYFGEKIALYFSFLGFYTRLLVFPTILGIILFVPQIYLGRYDVKNSIPIYSAFMAIWATLFLEAWKREQVTNAYNWNMLGFEAHENARSCYPGPSGETRVNPITGEEELWYDPDKRKAKYFGSFSFLFACIIVVMGAIVSILVLRKYLEDGQFGWSAGIINGIIIAMFNLLYKEAAVKLTTWENHRTDTDYEDALIA
eukprot:Rmarinus@m.20923